MSGAIGTFAIGQTPIGGAFAQSYTAGDIINLALKSAGLLGVGQTALAEDIADALSALNGMVGLWNRRRWLIWHLVDVSVTTTGAERYSVGPGGDFDVVRPDQIEAAYFRQIITTQPNQVDYPLTLIPSYEDYSLIALKSLSSWPAWLYYDPAFPLGYAYPWPIPQSGAYYLHLVIKDNINGFADTTTPINLPPEYFTTLWSNLAVNLGAIFPGCTVDERTDRLAMSSLETVRAANAQIPLMKMPAGLGRGGLYNIYSDSIYSACFE